MSFLIVPLVLIVVYLALKLLSPTSTGQAVFAIYGIFIGAFCWVGGAILGYRYALNRGAAIQTLEASALIGGLLGLIVAKIFRVREGPRGWGGHFVKNYRTLQPFIGVLAVLGSLTVFLVAVLLGYRAIVAVMGNIPPSGHRTFFGALPSAWSEGLRLSGAVLTEEDEKSPYGRRYLGSATWRDEMVSPGPGLAPELAVHADVEIPQRQMTMAWSLRHNGDQALSGSYAIEITFSVPVNFSAGGIAGVPGVLMKQSEQARGTPLTRNSVRTANGSFLLGLPGGYIEMRRGPGNPWFDIPIVYTNGARAIVAMEKGPSGDRAFADAFTAWEK